MTATTPLLHKEQGAKSLNQYERAWDVLAFSSWTVTLFEKTAFYIYYNATFKPNLSEIS